MHPDVFNLPVTILLRDEAFVAVNKPSGMLVHRTSNNRDPVVVMTFVREAASCHVYPVHRLDRDTSGIVLVALTLEAARPLYDAFRQRRVDKVYHAVVAGRTPPSARLDTPLEKQEGVFQEALTEYLTLAHGDDCSLVEVHPRNGRRHQIRRHLAGAGHPILGDRFYGDPPRDEARFGLTRLALHASRLAFPHPLNGNEVVVEAILPDDLAQPMAKMGITPPALLG